MQNVINFLHEYSGLLLAFVTFVLVIITGLYAYWTRRIAQSNEKLIKAMQEEHEAQRRPYIQIRTYDRLEAIVCLLIKNVGKTAARNVKFEIDQDIFQYGKPERNIKEFPLFKDGAEAIPPETEYHIDLAQYQLFFTEEQDERKITKLPLLFKITCTYSFFDKNVKEETVIDIKSTRKTAVATNEIAYRLKEMKEELAKIRTEMKNLKR